MRKMRTISSFELSNDGTCVFNTFGKLKFNFNNH